LFTSLAATPRTLANSLTGFLVEGGDISLGGVSLLRIDPLGWQRFFYFCFAAALPGMLLLFKVAPWNGDRMQPINETPIKPVESV